MLVRPGRPTDKPPRSITSRYTSYNLPTLPGIQPPSNVFMTGYQARPMLLGAQPQLLLAPGPALVQQPALMAVAQPQFGQPAPVPQGQPFAGGAPSFYPPQMPGQYPQQAQQPYASIHHPSFPQQPAHHQQQFDSDPAANAAPRPPTLGQRIMRAFRMPTGRASTVASSRPGSRDGDFEEEEEPPRGRSLRQRNHVSPRVEPKHATKQQVRKGGTRSHSQAVRSPPQEPSPVSVDHSPVDVTNARMPSPMSDHATVHSDDYVPNMPKRRDVNEQDGSGRRGKNEDAHRRRVNETAGSTMPRRQSLGRRQSSGSEESASEGNPR